MDSKLIERDTKHFKQKDGTYLEISKGILFKERTYYDHPPHYHKDIEVVFMLEGTWTTRCNGKKYTLTSGSVFIAPANSIHSSVDHQTSNSILLVIDPALLLGSARQLEEKSPSTLIWHDPNKDSFIWDELQYVYNKQNTLSQQDLLLHLSAIISYILADTTLEDNLQQKRIENQILKYCQQHYTEDITISTLASALYVIKSHISHTFSDIIGVSFLQHINNLRLDAAEDLLKYTKKSCNQIAIEAGFPSSRTFNNVFNRKHNMTPLQYRKLHKETQNIANP